MVLENFDGKAVIYTEVSFDLMKGMGKEQCHGQMGQVMWENGKMGFNMVTGK